jgi:predicted nucleotidyltransferase
MDFTDPSLAITPTLDGPVLIALALAGKPFTVSELANKTSRGSEIGIRRSLGRLVAQGVVTATEMGNSRVYNLNREHVAAKIAIDMSDLRSEVWRRISRQFEKWAVRPIYACVFGSAARHQADLSSDIDLLLIHPSTLAELSEAQKSRSFIASLGMWANVVSTRVMTEAQTKAWDKNVDALDGLVRSWTGNPLQVVSISAIEWSEHRRRRSEIYQEIERDEVRLYDEFAPITYKFPKRQVN